MPLLVHHHTPSTPRTLWKWWRRLVKSSLFRVRNGPGSESQNYYNYFAKEAWLRVIRDYPSVAYSKIFPLYTVLKS